LSTDIKYMILHYGMPVLVILACIAGYFLLKLQWPSILVGFGAGFVSGWYLFLKKKTVV